MSHVRPVGARFRDFQARLGQPGGGHPPHAQSAPARHRGDGGEQQTVPPASFSSYYGRPIIKAPVWRSEIVGYLFTGGLAAGSSLIAAGADLTGRPALRRAGRLASLAATAASTYFLIHDLGRPERFHHMLRVARPTSPMSVGTWILAAFGPAAGVAAVSELSPWLPPRGPLGLARRLLPAAGRAAGLTSAALAPALATYTAVLLADTALPAWHDAYPDLPVVFAGSALAAASGLSLITAPPAQTGPVRRLAVAAAAVELYGARGVERMGLTGEPYRKGRSGRLVQVGRVLLAAGAAGALLGGRSRIVSAVSGVALLASSVATRLGVYTAGVASARDPKYTVVPQRQRSNRKEQAAGPQPGRYGAGGESGSDTDGLA